MGNEQLLDREISDFTRSVLWHPDTDPLTPNDVQSLLINDNFGDLIARAIILTRELGALEEQEYAFAAFRIFGINGADIRFTPLIPGTERSVPNFTYKAYSAIYEDPENLSTAICFTFHTHPIVKGRLIEAILEKKVGTHDLFSVNDLRCFHELAHNGDHSLIFAIGFRERPNIGKVIMISFRTYDAFDNIDSVAEEIVARSQEYKNSNRDHFDVYREFGLNVASLTVNLEQKPHFSTPAIKKISRLITKRVY